MAGTLTSQEVFGFLLPEQVDSISNAAEKVSARAGDMIYQKGDKAEDIFIVLDGEVTLKLPGASGLNIVIDQLRRGEVFGGALGYGRSSYALSAQCTGDAQLLKVKHSALKSLMDRDPRLGYTLQGYISTSYFNRYVDTMKKLQAIVMNLPVEA
ncbi:MAG: cyclic nucleotide-binding domain-containing protein [Gemmatimonadota bacterium]|jgi:CRP-like cAMP-binding protein